ncbi:MAG TPA: hypothetical protein VJR89_13950 [Polyangiales bacterium]|nr:hypothetical protein [Polyangiales bacterium]
MHSATLLLLSLLFGFVPAQTRQASRVVLERNADVCANLDGAQCCAQMLEIAGFRATGDQLPAATKTPVRLSCEAPQKVFPENSCRLLALARGFGAKETVELCEPGKLAKRCNADDSCRQCVEDLDKLSWRSSQRACYALTYVQRPESGAKVVSVTRGKANPNNPDAQFVRLRRTVLR